MAINEEKLNTFLGKAVGDLGSAMSAALMLVGDRLGVYKELAKGALTATDLAHRTNTNERYVREWLGNQGAGGYVEFDAESNKWSLSPEQAQIAKQRRAALTRLPASGRPTPSRRRRRLL